MTLEADLRQAIAAGALRLDYQPIVDLRTGHLAGVEALSRWTHPELGVISPCEFIPLAEATGLIVDLGAGVLRSACRQAAQWRVQHPAQPITVALNLSVRQLHEPGLVHAVRQVLTETSLDPAALVLEVTAGTLTEGLEVGRTLQRLRDSGVAIAIDDFGTGYSSLARLRDLPVDQVKLDKSFLADLGNGGEAPSPLLPLRLPTASA